MEFEGEVVFLVLLHKKLKKKKRKLKFWTHPLLNAKQEHGVFYTAFKGPRNDESKFCNYFRMSIVAFDELLQHIRNDVAGSDTNMRSYVPLEERLAVTLR
jgi:hypothetical protein